MRAGSFPCAALADLDGRFLHPPMRLVCDGHVALYWGHACASDIPPAAGHQLAVRMLHSSPPAVAGADGRCCSHVRVSLMHKLDIAALSEAAAVRVALYVDGQPWLSDAAAGGSGEALLCDLEPGPHLLTAVILSRISAPEDLHADPASSAPLTHVFIALSCEEPPPPPPPPPPVAEAAAANEASSAHSAASGGGGGAPSEWARGRDGGAGPAQTAWATMAYTESYLPGVLTLLHSLRAACAGGAGPRRDAVLLATPPLTGDLLRLQRALARVGAVLR